ncbi:MAG: hypothetical protein IKK10_04435 [Clostridia bacterium]|nr:hypothetical protein [Clostridia bacterium]
MKFKTKKKIIVFSTVFTFVFFLFSLFYHPFPNLQKGILLGLAIISLVLNFVLLRCPYCSKHIRHLNQNYCAYCGREFDDEEIY